MLYNASPRDHGIHVLSQYSKRTLHRELCSSHAPQHRICIRVITVTRPKSWFNFPDDMKCDCAGSLHSEIPCYLTLASLFVSHSSVGVTLVSEPEGGRFGLHSSNLELFDTLLAKLQVRSLSFRSDIKSPFTPSSGYKTYTEALAIITLLCVGTCFAQIGWGASYTTNIWKNMLIAKGFGMSRDYKHSPSSQKLH